MTIARSNSFDLLRVVAATAVLVSHAFALTGRPEPGVANASLGTLGVYVFFATSGYLVYQSLERDPHSLRFMMRRALRIYPGLMAMLICVVLIFGSMFTVLPVREYLTRGETWGYFSKLLLVGNDRLPGLFLDNPYPGAVNSSLWTLKWEVFMYCLLATMSLFFGVKRRVVLGFYTVAFFGLTLVVQVVPELARHLGMVRGGQFWSALVMGDIFLAGCWLAVVRDGFRPGVVGCLITFAAHGVLSNTAFDVLALVFVVSFCAIAFGESNFARAMKLDVPHDVSYGIYIYAFPLQQCIVSLGADIGWVTLCLLVMPPTLLLAYLSWRWVEAPALALKRLSLLSRTPRPAPAST